MAKTYTYTARSADDPARAVTFTLQDHQLKAELVLSSEKVERSLKAAGQEAAARQPDETDKWIAAVAEPLKERDNEPFALGDVDASAEGEELRVTAWNYTHDRRLQPIVIAMERVDNPQAASAFAREINRRKLSATRRARFMRAVGLRLVWYLAGFVSASCLIVWVLNKGGGKS
jgi:hypothetical protein